MVIHAPKPHPVEAGLWVFCDQTEELIYAETHLGSTARTQLPTDLDRHDRRIIAQAVDQLLNAAGVGRDALDQAFRAKYAGDRIGLVIDQPRQDAYWNRIAIAGSLGAQVRRRLPGGTPIIVNDEDDGTSIVGGGSGSGGSGGDGSGDRDGGGGGGGGGFGRPGSSGSGGSHRGSGGGGGRSYGDDYPAALVSGDFSALRRGSSGGSGGRGGEVVSARQPGGGGGSGGTGVTRVSTADLVLAETRNGASGGRGSSAEHNNQGGGGGGGGGSGGIIVGISGRAISGTARTSGGSGGSGGSGHPGAYTSYSGSGGGRGGNGRVVLFYVTDQTVNVTNAVLTSYQLLPALPSGGLLVM